MLGSIADMYHVGNIQLQVTEIPNKSWFKQIQFILVTLQDMEQDDSSIRSVILGGGLWFSWPSPRSHTLFQSKTRCGTKPRVYFHAPFPYQRGKLSVRIFSAD